MVLMAKPIEALTEREASRAQQVTAVLMSTDGETQSWDVQLRSIGRRDAIASNVANLVGEDLPGQLDAYTAIVLSRVGLQRLADWRVDETTLTARVGFARS